MPTYRVTAVEAAAPQNGTSPRRRRRTFFISAGSYAEALARATQDAVQQHKFSDPSIVVEARSGQ